MQEVNLVLIKQRRLEMHFTLLEMAEALGFKDASTYWKYEKGVYKFNAEHLPIVAAKLKLKMTEIFFTPTLAKIAK